MYALILFTTLLHGGYIEETRITDVCNADELNIAIHADDRKFYYCEAVE